MFFAGRSIYQDFTIFVGFYDLVLLTSLPAHAPKIMTEIGLSLSLSPSLYAKEKPNGRKIRTNIRVYRAILCNSSEIISPYDNRDSESTWENINDIKINSAR